MADYRAFKEQWSVNIFVKRYEKGEINFVDVVNGEGTVFIARCK